MTGRFGPLRLAISLACLVAAACQPIAQPGTATPSSSIGPTAPAGPSAPPSFVRPTPNPSPTFLVHEVEAGESLTSIARTYGTTARSIAYWNRDRYPSLDPDSADYAPDRIVVGWTLRLIPTEVVDEDELPEPSPTPVPSPRPSQAPTPTPTADGSPA